MSLALPRGSCDTHFHVFGPKARFPFADGRRFEVADATKEQLFALHERLGIERGVVVQSTVHGYDNSAAADLIAAGKGRYLGVALVQPGVEKAFLLKLHSQGFRGARFHYMRHLEKGAPLDEVLAFAQRLAGIGWHLQLHLEADLLPEMSPALKRSPVPVVIDHMARLDASKGMDHAGFKALMKLLESPGFRVKVSGCERASRQGPPYRDALPFARKLVAEFGDRVLWGTDWPHPNLAGPVPDDGQLVDLLAEVAPTAAQRQALLVDNPARFYGFS